MVNADIARRNKAFTSATRTQKRVLIAKDIIEQINLQKIRPMAGVWAQPYFDKGVNPDDSFQQTFLEGKVNVCQCCALGAIGVSCILFKNEVINHDVKDVTDYGDISYWEGEDVVGFFEIFNKKQLDLIEFTYECGCGATNECDLDYSLETVRRARNFADRYDDSHSRLIAIMQNIIKNNGYFKP